MNKRSLRPAQSICVFIILALISGELVTAQEVTADDVVCVQCVDKKDLANGAVGRVKISDGAVSNDKIANNAIDSRTLAKDAVGSFQLKRKAVTHDNIRDDAVTPEKIADLVRTISVPANSFSRDPTGTIVTADYQGLRWQADMTGTAAYTLSKPADYAGGESEMGMMEAGFKGPPIGMRAARVRFFGAKLSFAAIDRSGIPAQTRIVLA